AGGGNQFAELYDPIANTFADSANVMNDQRSGHTATLLPDGTVLLAGGGAADNLSCEIYDPTADSFTALAAKLHVPRKNATAIYLPGSPDYVLVFGGVGSSASASTDTRKTELYDLTG